MENQEKFAVYLIRKGRYLSPQWLNAQNAVYLAKQEQNNYDEIRVTDSLDNLVLNIIGGEIIFPTKQDLKKVQV